MSCVKVQAGQENLSPLFLDGLIIWWDAERLTSTGNFLNKAWSVGAGQNGINANVTFVPGVANGHTVARYNGINSVTTTTLFGPSPTFSCFIVSKLAAAGGVYIGFCDAAATNQMVVSNAGENFGCFDTIVHPTSGLIDNHTAFSFIGVVSAGGTCIFYQNGTIVPPAAGGVLSAMNNIVTFGGVIGVFSAFDVAEVLVYAGVALTGTRLTQVFQYLKGKYNL
jgi:hypothetical protein